MLLPLAPLLLSLAAGPARSQDLLVPEFTPATPDDFTFAYMIYSMVVDQLAEEGVRLADGDALRDLVGEEAERCGESVSCPSGLWPAFPDAKLAMVGSVGLADGGVHVRVDWYTRDGFSSYKTVERVVETGNEFPFAQALARATVVLAGQVEPPASAAVPDLDEEPPRRSRTRKARDAGSSEEGERSRRAERPAPEPAAPKPPREPRAQAAPGGSRGLVQEVLLRLGLRKPEIAKQAGYRRERRSMRVPWVAYEAFRESGVDRDRWVREHYVHDRPWAVEADLGPVMGDVHRTYDLRLSYAAESSAEVGHYAHDAFTRGVGMHLGVAAYGSPLWWLEAGLRLGFDTGRKELTTGWEGWNGAEVQDGETLTWESSSALRGVVEPRVRLHALSRGQIRPWAVVLADLRAYDAYEIPETDGVTWRARGGGWTLGIGGGLGAAWELRGRRNVTLEVTRAVRLAPDAYHVSWGWLAEAPEVPEEARGTTRVLLGGGLRF